MGSGVSWSTAKEKEQQRILDVYEYGIWLITYIDQGMPQIKTYTGFRQDIPAQLTENQELVKIRKINASYY